MPRLARNKFLNMLLYAAVPLAAVLLLTKCWHNHTSTPVTRKNDATGITECRVVCLDCGASALYDPFNFQRTGHWEYLPVIGAKKEITPHVYQCA